MFRSNLPPRPPSVYYKLYKEDTAAFIVWLGQAAASCGNMRISDTSPSTLLRAVPTAGTNPCQEIQATTISKMNKRRNRKAAKRARSSKTFRDLPVGKTKVGKKSKYGVSIRELSKQVDIISEFRPKIQMPPEIQARLERTIELRQWSTEWYEYLEPWRDQTGHKFFIKFLKDALVMLGSKTEEKVYKGRLTKGDPVSEREKPLTKELDLKQLRYALLPGAIPYSTYYLGIVSRPSILRKN
jgi:hypothetical protein